MASLSEGTLAVSTSCTQLRTFRVEYDISDEILVALGAHCPHLTALAAHMMCTAGIKIADAGVCALAQGCPQLRKVSTTRAPTPYLPSPHFAAPVTMVGITALATHCPHLRELDVHKSVVSFPTAAGATTIVVRRLHVTVRNS
jgi:hypothetical protein